MMNAALAYDEPKNQKDYSKTTRIHLGRFKPSTIGYRRVS